MFRVTEPTKLPEIKQLAPSRPVIPPQKSRLRAVHNVANGPQVDVYLDDKIVLRGVPYKAISDYLEIPAGNHMISVKAAGTDNVVINGEVNLANGVSYTFIVHGALRIEPLLVDDTLDCPELGQTHVRLINAAATFGPIDAYMNGVKVFDNIRYGELENPEYISIEADTLDFVIMVANNQIPIVGPISIKLRNGGIYTIITSGIVGNPTAPPTILVSEDTNGACVVIGL